MIRPAEFHVFTGVVAVIEGRECALLSELVNLDKVRASVRGRDARLDQALLGIRKAALHYLETSATGSKSAPVAEVVPPSPQQQNNTISTTTAATLLGISDRAIRQPSPRNA